MIIIHVLILAAAVVKSPHYLFYKKIISCTADSKCLYSSSNDHNFFLLSLRVWYFFFFNIKSLNCFVLFIFDLHWLENKALIIRPGGICSHFMR